MTLSALLCSCAKQGTGTTSSAASLGSDVPLRMGISPYQDTAFLVNAKPLGLEKKYGTRLELLTLSWEEILPAVASAGKTVDAGYASLTDYLTKSENLNSGSDDSVLFIYPLYVFEGYGFVSFNKSVPELNHHSINDPALVKKFLSYKIGVPKSSMGQMLDVYACPKSQHKIFGCTIHRYGCE